MADSRKLKALLLAAAIALTYMTARNALWAVRPVGEWVGLPGTAEVVPINAPEPQWIFHADLWLARERVVTVYRVLGLLACLAVSASLGSWRSWGWHGGSTQQGQAFVGLVSLAWAMVLIGGQGPTAIPSSMCLEGWLLTIPVALFEEACFRGLLFTSLKSLLKPQWAALWSSLFFACWHYGVQGVEGWPKIVCFGLAACAAMTAGLGLPWLAFWHELLDGVFLQFDAGGRASSQWELFSLVACLGLASWAWQYLSRAPSEC